MKEEELTVGFALKQITTEQFAIIEEAFEEGKDINLETQMRFGVDADKAVIAIFALFKFEQAKIPFLQIETGCHFQVEEAAWKTFSGSSKNKLTVPKGLMRHLTMLTIGTTRGILHAKTESTLFNQFILPTINVNELIKEDVVLEE